MSRVVMDGMDAAQASHDRAEPSEQSECAFCDGQGTVSVTEVVDCTGRVYYFKWDAENPGTPCPICKLGMTLNGERLE